MHFNKYYIFKKGLWGECKASYDLLCMVEVCGGGAAIGVPEAGNFSLGITRILERLCFI